MRNLVITTIAAVMLAGCGGAAQSSVVNSNTAPANTPASSNSLVVSSHKTDQPSTAPTSSSSTTSPMQKPVDIAEQTAAIEKAEKDLKGKSNDPAAKKALAKAYFDRAFVLTEAAQYRSALGDFRKGLKLDPTDVKAKEMHDQIIDIFKSIGREPPKEGEEPPPVGMDKPKQ